MSDNELNRTVGVFPVCNTGGIIVHKLEDERVLASFNGKDPRWCGVTEKPRCECGGDEDDMELESGFLFGSFFVPFSEIMRV